MLLLGSVAKYPRFATAEAGAMPQPNASRAANAATINLIPRMNVSPCPLRIEVAPSFVFGTAAIFYTISVDVCKQNSLVIAQYLLYQWN